MESFIAGFCYGGTTVLVGQPLDTIKTLQQAKSQKQSMVQIARQLYVGGGIPAFYRGGVPLLLGGGLMRSAQFGVYNSSLQMIRDWQGGATLPHNKWRLPLTNLYLDPQVIAAGFMGGIGRGCVEGPFEMVKVRRQIVTQWRLQEILKGSGTTLLRNSFLFASFAVYMDLSKQIVPGGLSPFLMGGICANLAWLTVWPLDVVKSRLQSGKYEGKGLWQVLKDTYSSGHLMRGLVPGLTRSFIANGSSMVVYKMVETELKERWRTTDDDRRVTPTATAAVATSSIKQP